MVNKKNTGLIILGIALVGGAVALLISKKKETSIPLTCTTTVQDSSGFTLTLEIKANGGTAPYHLDILWGDGETTDVSPGIFQHTYDKSITDLYPNGFTTTLDILITDADGTKCNKSMPGIFVNP